VFDSIYLLNFETTQRYGQYKYKVLRMSTFHYAVYISTQQYFILKLRSCSYGDTERKIQSSVCGNTCLSIYSCCWHRTWSTAVLFFHPIERDLEPAENTAYGNIEWEYRARQCLEIGLAFISFFYFRFGIRFYLHNPSDRTMAVVSTQPLTEMSTRNICWR
jgi:hypothetical protein